MRVYKKKLERIVIIGNRNEDEEKADRYLKYGGYHCTYSGLKKISKYKSDRGKFKMIAEREI